ncbi:MAG TPA: DUF4976 domain-containing protein, partial [Planctomycetaceae bacterium]|nr:DUF4976 domain-containing protein [Planctomycetaceae bacterium]
SIRTSRYRYTEWGEDGSLGKELYDHDSDPAEMHNLAGNAKVAKIEAELAKELHFRIERARRAPKGVRQLKAR